MNQALLQYSYLQVLDLLTTLAFLVHGLREGNPMVRFMLDYTSNPLTGLIMVKLVAVALGLYCWKVGKLRLLSNMNWMFAAVVAWNVTALVVSAV